MLSNLSYQLPPCQEETDQAVRRMAYVSSVVPILLLVLEELESETLTDDGSPTFTY